MKANLFFRTDTFLRRWRLVRLPRRHFIGESRSAYVARVNAVFHDGRLDPESTGRRSRIADRMLVCSNATSPVCRCHEPAHDGLDAYTCGCLSPEEAVRLGWSESKLARADVRRPRCIACGAPLHGVRN